MSAPNPATERKPQISRPDELLNRLLEFDSSELPVISLYLNGRVNEHGKHDRVRCRPNPRSQRSRECEDEANRGWRLVAESVPGAFGKLSFASRQGSY